MENRKKTIYLIMGVMCLFFIIIFFFLFRSGNEEHNRTALYHRLLESSGKSGRPHLTEIAGIHSVKTIVVEDVNEAQKFIDTNFPGNDFAYYLTSEEETQIMETKIKEVLHNAQKIEILFFGEENKGRIRIDDPGVLQKFAENFAFRSNVEFRFPMAPPHSIGMTVAEVIPSKLTFVCEREKIYLWGDSFQIGEAQIDPAFVDVFFQPISEELEKKRKTEP